MKRRRVQLICIKCTRYNDFEGDTDKEALEQAKRFGWSKTGSFDSPQFVCPKCPKVEA